MLTIVSVILSLHFGRIFLGNLYRASPAFVLPREPLARTLGMFTTEVSQNADGSTTEKQVEDVARITKLERCKFFLHCLLAN
jgi:hypothetical protein